MDGSYLLIRIMFGGLMSLGINAKLFELVFKPFTEENDYASSRNQTKNLIESSKMQNLNKDKK